MTPRRVLGAVFAAPRLRDVTRVSHAGDRWISKRPRWYAAGLIACGNLVLRVTGSEVRFLAAGRWRRWECEVHAALGRRAPARGPRGALLTEEMPGSPVAGFLMSPTFDLDTKLRVLRAALAALRALHAASARRRDGADWLLSHGDAIAGNALFDPATGTARWLDFETRHVRRSSAVRRQADDVWTLARSATHLLGRDAIPEIVTIVSELCDERALRVALALRVRTGGNRATMFDLARVPLAAQTETVLRRVTVQLIG